MFSLSNDIEHAVAKVRKENFSFLLLQIDQHKYPEGSIDTPLDRYELYCNALTTAKLQKLRQQPVQHRRRRWQGRQLHRPEWRCPDGGQHWRLVGIASVHANSSIIYAHVSGAEQFTISLETTSARD